MALKDCIKKLGAALNKQDLDAIKALVDGGMPEMDAVQYHLKKLEKATQPDEVELVAYHNINPEGLVHAVKMGGLAVPSVSIAKKGYPHTGFGSITLIGTKDLVNPAVEPVYDADAYTARYPDPFYKPAKRADVSALIDSVKAEQKEFGDHWATSGPWSYLYGDVYGGRTASPHKAVSDMIRSDAWKAKFLREQGVDVKPVMRPGENPQDLGNFPSLIEFLKNNPSPQSWYHDQKVPEVVKWVKGFKAAARKAADDFVKQKGGGDPELESMYKKLGNDLYYQLVDKDTGDLNFAPVDRLERGMEAVGTTVVDKGATTELLNKKLKGKENEFQKWVEHKVFPIMPDPELQTGRKRVPYTLDNIVAFMSRKGRSAEKGLVFGEGNTRAMASKRFKDWPTLKKAAAEGIQGEKEISQAREEAQKLMETYRDKVYTHHTSRTWRGNLDTFEALDSSMRAIARLVKMPASRRNTKGLRDALRAEGFNVDGITEAQLEIGVDAANTMMIAPVPYFEAKPDRAVKLNEFVGAAIPANAPQEVRDILDQHGIVYTTYGKTEELRIKAVNKLTEKLSKKKPGVLFQSGRSPIGFYSALADAASNLKQEKGTAEQMLAQLAKAPGVKQAEIEATGLDDFLKLQGKSITKQQIVDYLDANGVQVEDTVLGSTSRKDGLTYFRSPDGTHTVEDDQGNVLLSGVSLRRATDFIDDQYNGDSTKFSQYVVPGGQNYKELLLTLPERKVNPAAAKNAESLKAEGYSASVEYNEYTDQSSFVVKDPQGENIFQASGKRGKITADQALEYFSKSESKLDSDNANRRANFKSSHFEQSNILAHVRFNERADADGKRVLFIEEIQSDWAQKGRKEGFTNNRDLKEITRDELLLILDELPKPSKEEISNNYTSDYKKSADEIFELITAENTGQYPGYNVGDPLSVVSDILIADHNWTENAAVELSKRLRKFGATVGIPSAPFVTSTDAWVSLAMKRMITYAAENGFDRVAWTTGEQQADRYDLSKRIAKVESSKTLQGAYAIRAIDHAGKAVIDDVYTADRLPEIVGKDLAKKIVEETPAGSVPGRAYAKEFSGLDLKVGGEGMKAFYDSIVPKVADKIVKKMGGKIGSIGVEVDAAKAKSLAYFLDWMEQNAPDMTRGDVQVEWSKGEDSDYVKRFISETVISQQPGFDITPQMREQVENQGLSLFQKAGRNDLGLYSAVEQAVIDVKLPQWLKDQPAPGVEIWSKVSKTPGVKLEELDWMGLEDFLKADPKAKFTRQQVLEYVSANGVDVVQVTADTDLDESDGGDIDFNWRESVDDDVSQYEFRADELANTYGTNEQDEELYRGALNHVVRANEDAIKSAMGVEQLTEIFDETQDDVPQNLYVPSKKKRISELSEEDRVKANNIWKNGSMDERRNWIKVGVEGQPGGRYLPEVYKYVVDNYEDEIKHAYTVDAEEKARSEYMEDPFSMYTDEYYDITIEGSEGSGYTIFHNGDVIEEGVHGFSEAEVRARAYLSDDRPSPEHATKWGQYVMDGNHRNYRELKLTLPTLGGEAFVKSTHFDEPNIVAFLRVTDRDLMTGETVEQQPARKVDYKIAVEGDGDIKVLTIRESDNDVLVGSARLKDNADLDKSVSELKAAIADPKRRKGVERILTFNKGYAVDDNGDIIYDIGVIKPRTKTTYFIDEFQSDWHQEGRKKGYRTGEPSTLLSDEMNGLDHSITTVANRLFDRAGTYSNRFVTYSTNHMGSEVILFNYESQDDQVRQDSVNRRNFENHMWDMLRNSDETNMVGNVLSTERNFVAEVINSAVAVGDLNLNELREKIKRSDELDKMIKAEREGVPDAPFKGDAWLNLGLKRAIVDAVDNGHQAIAWPNAQVLVDRWSERYRSLYENQYDTKMVSIVKKLTGIQPKLMDSDGKEMVITNRSEDEIRGELNQIISDSELLVDKLYAKLSRIDNSKENLNYFTDAVANFTQDLVQINNPRFRSHNTSVDARHDWIKRNLSETELSEFGELWNRRIKVGDELSSLDGSEGYWIIPITNELKAKVTENSYPLFQPKGEETMDFKRGAIQLLANNKRLIHLGENSDASTLVHELAHSYLELEKQLAAEFGLDDNQRKLLDWLGVESFDDIKRAQHEMYAETFEVYLETGKAPSPFLREVFANFRRWISNVYKVLRGRPNANLDQRITEYFDRLLATEEEIEMVQANPVFDQFFRSKEQSGMTDVEWEKYQKQRQKVKDTATATVDQKVIAELKKRKSAEWKEEKDPIVEEEKQRLLEQPVYKIIRETATHPMDYNAVVEVTGGKVPGKLIGRAKKGGINPMDYAEAYGFPSVKAMLDAIDTAPALGKAADDAAEKRMIAKYGDILNDGSIEEEARNAIHSDEQATLLLMELKALNKKTPIDRQYLESEARRMIAGMKYSEIKPDRYFKAEIRAARKAMVAKTDAEKFEAKAQQIANHYLYRRAMEVRDEMETQRKYVRGVQTRNYSTKEVDPAHVQNMKVLAKSYEMRKDDPSRPRNYASVLDWMITQMQDENHYVQLEIIDVNLAKAMIDRQQGKPVTYDFPAFDDLTADELQALYDQLKHLRFVGGKMSESAKAELMISRANSAESITRNSKKSIPAQHERSAMASTIDSVVKFGFSHLRVRSIFNTLDGYQKLGPMDKEYRLLTNAFNKELELTDQLAKSMDTAFKPVFKIINRRRQTTITKQDGREWTLSHRARFVLGLNWGNEGNRQAVLEGLNNKFQDNYTEADVVQMLSTMSKPELVALNDVWAAKESLWPELSSTEVRIKGVAPPKIQATPFEINGVKLTGGHYRLHYVVDPADSGRKDITIEDNQRDSIMLKTASSLHERVGSGGRQVDLELNHLFRDIQEHIHYIAFAEQAQHLNAMFKGAKNPVVGAITQGYGQPYYDNLISTLDGFIHPAEPTTGMWKLMRYVRTNLTYAFLAGSIRNLVQQPVAVTNAFSQLGAANTLAGAIDFYSDPVSNWEKVREKSAFMRHRTELINREATEQLTKIDSIHPVWGAIKRGAFMPQTFMDSLVAFPTWMGALRKYQIENPDASEDEGIRYADEMVKHTIGSGLALDLGHVLSGTEAEKQITFMGTFFNLTVNLHVDNYQQYKRGQISGFEYARRLGWMAIAPAILTAWILDDLPEDDDEKLWDMLKQVLFYNFSSVFMVRDLVSSFEGFDPSIPGLSFGKGIARVGKEMSGLITGDEEFDMNTIASIIRGVEPLAPLPGSGQVARTLEGMADDNQGTWGAIVEGKERN